MKPYHEELLSKAWSIWQHHISPKHFILMKALSNCYTFAMLIARFFTFDMFWNLSTNLPPKNKGGGALKDRFFHFLKQWSALGSNQTMWPPFLHPSKKAFFSPSVWTRREYIWTVNWKESLPIYFGNCRDVSYLHEL